MQEHHKGRLTPFAVPWALGGRHAETNFELLYSEGGDLLVEVTAQRLIGPKFGDWETCRVQLTFLDPNRFNFGRGFDEDDFISIYEYERDFVTFGPDDDANNELREKCFRSGVYADPFAYEVIDSVQLRDTRLGSIGYREFLLLGEDYCLNVVAKDFKSRILPAKGPLDAKG